MANNMLNERTWRNLPPRPDQPATAIAVPQEGSMTVAGTVGKTFVLLALAVVAGTVGWRQADAIAGASGFLVLAVFLGLLGLSWVTATRPQISPVTGPIYAVVIGVFAGMISSFYELAYGGIVLQAVFATASVFAVCLSLYSSGIVKVTRRFVAVTVAATGGIMLMYLVSIVLSLFGVRVGFLYDPSPLGIIVSVVICFVAALNLFLDFELVRQGVARGAPTYMEWYCAFGLMATLIWLYLEMLRLLSKLRN
ncbi:MAG: Bax inhibitor-1/YccA family protein [Actinomycetota bacterium]